MGDAAPATADDRDAATKKRPRSASLSSPAAAAAAAADGADLRRVAEIVMVLSAMARMRGGREPTPAEKALAAEARGRLADACQGVRPKDIFTTEAVRVVVEDLGLNRTGGDLRPTRMSIAEKLLLTKRKMEGPKEVPTQPSAYPPNHHSSTFASSESHGATPLGASRILQDKSSVMMFPAGGVQGATYGPALASASTTKSIQIAHTQAGSNPVNPSSLSQSKQSYTEAAHFRIDGRAQVQASPEFVPRQTPTSSSVQSTYAATSAPPVKYGQLNKLLDHAPIKSEANLGGHPIQTAHQVMSNHEINPPNFQTGAGAALSGHHPSQGLAYVHPSSLINNHSDIAKTVQQILQEKVSVHASWTQPSIEYMNKPLSCQICTTFITDVESLLVCDACERGYHLKCLQSHGNKGVSKQEWHCQRCLAASHGKPLPPKYGRVTRAPPAQPQKVAPSACSSQVPPVKKPENLDTIFNQQKALANGNSDLPQDTNSFNMVGNPESDSVLNSRTSVTAVQISTTVNEISKGTCIGIEPPHSTERGDEDCTTTGGQSESSVYEKGVSQCDMKSESILHPNLLAESTSEYLLSKEVESTDHPRTTCESQTNFEAKLSSSSEASAHQQHDMNNSHSNELKELHPGKDNMNSNDVRLDELNKIQLPINGAMNLHEKTLDHGKPLELDSGNVEWVGNIIHVAEEKAYYLSCRVNGVLHRLHDHALITLDSDKFTPAKIQSFWEDKTSGSKWVTVNTYLFPGGLPKACNQPCKPANNEVYASNSCKTIMTGLISGPCEVLPDDRFKEENDKRTQLGDADNNLHPIFMCNWIYDESTCNFQPFMS